MKTLTATDARSTFFSLLKSALKTHHPIRVSSKEGDVILISEEEYENLMETAELLSIPGFKASIRKADIEIKNGEVFSFDQVFKSE
ncbi:MAG: Prevent-host-death family protein [Candidatus Peregrinibacteria bacterium GW2011_GWA2_44_7]|nr:MAG: Prevent-host-death family protein [Candidatus Peregrinibacteria bacterium GW2011_GWA2_44_7]